MAIIRRAVRRRVASFPAGGGVYRRPVYITQSFAIAIRSAQQIVTPGAAEVVVTGNGIGPIVAAGSGQVVVDGLSIAILTNGQSAVAVGAGVVEVEGARPIVINPGLLRVLLRMGERRRQLAARYSTRHPLPDYDVRIPVVMQPLPYRIIQITEGVIEVESSQVNIAADGSLYLPVGAAEIVVTGDGISVIRLADIAPGPAEIEVIGYQVKAAEIAIDQTPGSGEVEVVGYTPIVIATGAWYDQGGAEGNWSMLGTQVTSWSDMVIVQTAWRKQ